MSVTKIGDFAPGDVNLNNVMTWTNYNAIANDKVSFKFDSGPKIAEGSLFEAGGSLYEVTSDTDITGSSNTPNYIYFNPTTLAFLFSTTVPTYDDAKQGYYNTNQKALFLGVGNNDFQPLERGSSKIDEKIYSGSSLSVEDGAEVSIENGAELKIKDSGKVEVEDNGTVNFVDGSEVTGVMAFEGSATQLIVPRYAYNQRPSNPQTGSMILDVGDGSNYPTLYMYMGSETLTVGAPKWAIINIFTS